MKEKLIRKQVQDLGVAAWANMYGYKIAGKRGKNVYFDVKETEVDEFDKLCFDYFSSQCASFDNCLMALKKMNDYISPETN